MELLGRLLHARRDVHAVDWWGRCLGAGLMFPGVVLIIINVAFKNAPFNGQAIGPFILLLLLFIVSVVLAGYNAR